MLLGLFNWDISCLILILINVIIFVRFVAHLKRKVTRTKLFIRDIIVKKKVKKYQNLCAALAVNFFLQLSRKARDIQRDRYSTDRNTQGQMDS